MKQINHFLIKVTSGFLFVIAITFFVLFLSCILRAFYMNVQIGLAYDWKCLIKLACEFISICILATTAWTALIVYRRAQTVDETNLILSLQKLLDSDDRKKTYRYIDDRHSDSKDASRNLEDHEIDEYLAVLEHVNTFNEKGIMTDEQVLSQFQYRLKSIAQDEKVVWKLEYSEKECWIGLKNLIQKFAAEEYQQTLSKLKK